MSADLRQESESDAVVQLQTISRVAQVLIHIQLGLLCLRNNFGVNLLQRHHCCVQALGQVYMLLPLKYSHYSSIEEESIWN
jgi:hypothetical protein